MVLAGQWRRMTAERRELAAVVPSVNMAVMRARARRAAAAGSPVWVQAAAKASSPRSLRMWQARRMILRASDRAARLPFLRSLTCA